MGQFTFAFWLSMFPFVTGWMGQNHYAILPTAVYGFVLLMAASAYFILQAAIIRVEGKDSHLAKAIGRDIKGKLSLLCYIVAIGMAFVNTAISLVLYVFVAIMWLIPDRRIEHIHGQITSHEK